MPTDRREGWLRKLKIGDEVAYERSSFSRQNGIARVSAITPSGRVRIKVGDVEYEFSHLGRSGGGFDARHIYPVTDAIRDEVKRRVLLARIGETTNHGTLEQLSTDRLVALWEVLKSWELGA